MRPLTLSRLLWTCGALAALLFVVVVAALKLGAVPVSVVGLAKDLVRVALGRRAELRSEYRLIIFDIRLPRVVLGILVGASLSVAGASFQALLRNPLADPYVLGVSSGAALGAIISLVASPHLPLLTPLAAFAGALLTITAVYFLGRREGQLDSSTLLLAGIITASFFSAVIMFLMTTLPGRDLRGMAFWLMGDLSTPLPAEFQWILLAGLIVGAGAIYTTAADLNLLLTGEH
jgi:iron complex transport system permease protein